ncbi:MAG: SpaA isopeptide-forming pilin-related protein, partial [Coprobacillus sp.]
TLYEKMMLDGSAYKKTLDLIIEGLENAKVYYDKMGYDGANIGQRLYGFNLKYKTTVTNTSSGVVSNDVKITTDKQSYESDASVKHDFSSGINGVFSKGDIVVMKADSTQEYTEGMLETSKDISGIQDVQFEVYDAQSHEKLYFFNKDMSEHGSYQYYGKSASDSHFTSIVKTDDKGKFVLSGLLPNKEYYLKEVSTTDGYYENQNQKLVFTVDSRKVNYKLVENVARLVTLKKLDKNAEISGSLSALAGAKFGLFNDKNQRIDHFKKEVINGKTYFTYTNQASDNDELITLADGTLTIKNLPAGNYYIKEIAAPLGYILSDEKHHFTLDKNYNKDHEVVDLGNVYNLKNDASITVQKVDENTSVALENAAFELYKAPDGTSWSQGNHDDWQLITASQFNNANQYITSQKMDGNALLTNEDGEISISSLPKGNYYLKEVKAPNGYVLNKKHYHFTIDTGTKESQLYASSTLDETTVGRIDNNLITNKKGTGSIEIIKYDRFQGASLKVNG